MNSFAFASRAGLCGLLLCPWLASMGQAAPAVDLQDATIVSHFFSTGIKTVASFAGAEDIAKSRMLILVLTARLPASTTLRGEDFVLTYRHGGAVENRSKCEGIAVAEAGSASVVSFALGDDAQADAGPGQIHFELAFVVDAGVEAVDLYRTGSEEPISCRIGSKRPYSVFLSTNTTTDAMERGKAAIEKGSYQVVEAAHDLNPDARGLGIYYQKLAEPAAREISRRLRAELGVAPKVEPLDEETGSEVDILVWFGK
ncbi:MAG: hypothetical protein ACLQGV_07155 [Bryobacteraceae bacterium]